MLTRSAGGNNGPAPRGRQEAAFVVDGGGRDG
jgi:hypothetical protein